MSTSRSTGAPVQEPQHATVVDPDAHHVLFENEHVRVIRARAAHGWESAMHSHRPMVVVNLGAGRQKVTWTDGTTQLVDLDPGAVVWQDAAFAHSWELLAGEVNVVLVEVKSADARTSVSAGAVDSASAH
ncbi:MULTISPECIES: hypothetical protein [Nocardioides]|uniref:Cupin n=1 Tax=Nocardioides vastitatis TaxID=2568655 RepID=A0ABW0ZI26_9ACTN|nr:hypothetical protein [Nocardioides sp.]THI96651.1 hypothetical protein E7Z54_16510 [Nocardioides sp.]